MNIDGMLDKSCSIISVAQSRTSSGGVLDTESVLLADVPCSFRQLTGAESQIYGSDNVDKILRFYFKGDISINIGNKILYDSNYYDILDVYNVAGKSELQHVEARFDPIPITSGNYDT